MPPTSNHFGLEVGGAAMAVLAVMGDDGSDANLEKEYLAGLERNLILALTEGFGDGGYFYEHPGPGTIALHQTLTPGLQAMKVAAGKDFFVNRPNANWLTAKWIMEIIPDGKGRAWYPNGWPGGGYGTAEMERDGNSHGGQFSQGFGAVHDAYKPPMLWVYRNFVEPGEDQAFARLLKPGEKSYDSLLYPQRAVLAFVNWPLDMKAVNPAEVLPKVAVDHKWGHYVFRNRWQDPDDCLVAVTLGARGGARHERCMVWGLRQRLTLGVLPNCKPTFFRAAEDGSGVVSGEGGHFVGVDYSRASGAEALIVMVSPTLAEETAASQEPQAANAKHKHRGPGPVPETKSPRAKVTRIQAAKTCYVIVTLAAGEHPAARAEGDKVVVGGQTLSCDGEKIVFAKMTGPPRLRLPE